MALDNKKKLTQSELASIFGVSVQTIQNWINKEKIPKECTLLDIGALTREYISNKNNPQFVTSSKKEQRDVVKLELDKVALAKKTELLVDAARVTKKLQDVAIKYIDLTKSMTTNIQTIIAKHAPTDTAEEMSREVEDKIKRFTKETSELFSNDKL